MRLHDTATGELLPIAPQGGLVTLYVCGITPYDSSHLGHAFVFHVFDVLTRRLRDLGHRIDSVRNVTDVDDDMMRVSRERRVDYRTLAEDEVSRFDSAMRSINILDVTQAPRASAHVLEMVGWVNRLAQAGFAYVADGWVYFNTAAHPRFGRLSHLGRETMIGLSAQRGADPGDPRKRDPLDFVLWQPSLPDEPHWPSPWGGGRPGWHIECTVLASALLGTPITIHGGGDDLIFPHHECELAQAEAGGISEFVRHWAHVAAVGFKGAKMSKSLGNLVLIDGLLQIVPAATVRLLLAGHHYRQAWEYTEGELTSADHRRRSYVAAAASGARIDGDEAAELRAAFDDRLDDDLDTPGALLAADLAADAIQRAGARDIATGGVAAQEVLLPMLDLLGVNVGAGAPLGTPTT